MAVVAEFRCSQESREEKVLVVRVLENELVDVCEVAPASCCCCRCCCFSNWREKSCFGKKLREIAVQRKKKRRESRYRMQRSCNLGGGEETMLNFSNVIVQLVNKFKSS